MSERLLLKWSAVAIAFVMMFAFPLPVPPASADTIWIENVALINSGTMVNVTADAAGISLGGSFAWNDMNPANPPNKRSDFDMAYDSRDGVVVMFGGFEFIGMSGGPSSETWTYNTSTNTWTNKNPANPPGDRYDQAMAYDANTGEVVLFGGLGNCPGFGFCNDTWTYNVTQNKWTNKNPGGAPPVRGPTSMAYDSSMGVIVVFGGYNGAGMNDTWTYNASTNKWKNMKPASAPGLRFYQAMSYDSKMGEMVLFGGYTNTFASDTWTYKTSTNKWTNMQPLNAPMGRVGHSMTYNGRTGQVVLFGGYDGTGFRNDTWTYDTNLNKWTDSTTQTAPSIREFLGMTYDSSLGDIVLFGGCACYTTYLSDTWTYSLHHFPSGSYTSHAIDASGPVDELGTVEWKATTPANTNIRMQFRSAVTNASLQSKPFVGPDGTSATFYSDGQVLNGIHNMSRWFQYRAYLYSSDPAVTPVFNQIKVRYDLIPIVGLLSPADNLWTKTNKPTFSWSFKDNDSLGQGGYQLQLDNNSDFSSVDYGSGNIYSATSSYTPASAIQDGIWYWRVRTQDNDGAWGPFSGYRTIKIDTTAPSAFTPIATPRYWTNTDPVIKFNTTDSGIGMAYYQVKIDTGNFVNQTSPYTLPDLSDGQHNIIVRAFDKLGNYIDGRVIVYIDKAAPAAFTPTAVPSDWTGTNPVISFQTTDATSGIDHYEVTVDDGTFLNRTSPYTLPVLSDGQHNVTVRAIDKAGNHINGSVSVYIDKARPYAFTPTVDPKNWTSTDPTVHYTTTDATSSIDHYEVKVDNNPSITVQDTSYKLMKLPDGVHNITVRAVDKAGNYIEGKVPVYIDRTKPNAFTVGTDPSGWTSTDPKVSYNTTDATSGINHYEIKVDGAGSIMLPQSPYVVKDLAEGVHHITVRAFDNAGNYIDSSTVTVSVDRTKPSDPTIKVSTPKDKKVQLTINATDATSGVSDMSLSNDGTTFSPWEPYSSTRSWDLSSNGQKTVYVRVRDKAGNVAGPLSATVPAAPKATTQLSLLLWILAIVVIVVVVVICLVVVSRRKKKGNVQG